MGTGTGLVVTSVCLLPKMKLQITASREQAQPLNSMQPVLLAHISLTLAVFFRHSPSYLENIDLYLFSTPC